MPDASNDSTCCRRRCVVFSRDSGAKGAGKKNRGGGKTLAERSRYRKNKAGEWKFIDALPLQQNGGINANAQ